MFLLSYYTSKFEEIFIKLEIIILKKHSSINDSITGNYVWIIQNIPQSWWFWKMFLSIQDTQDTSFWMLCKGTNASKCGQCMNWVTVSRLEMWTPHPNHTLNGKWWPNVLVFCLNLQLVVLVPRTRCNLQTTLPPHVRRSCQSACLGPIPQQAW